ncbi:MAG: hypothetical protein ABIP75_15150 [Pyrinomonadaceae bacterium]
MKLKLGKLLIGLSVLALAFSIGLGIFLLWSFRNQPPEVTELEDPPCVSVPNYDSTAVPCSGIDISALKSLPDVGLRDLLNDPANYQDQVVRVHATLSCGMHGCVMWPGACVGADEYADVSFESSAARALVEAIQRDGDGEIWNLEYDLVAVGKFSPAEATDDHPLFMPHFKFTIWRLERGTKSDCGVRYELPIPDEIAN